MAAFFLELLSEEIPARMQARAAADLERLVGEAFSALSPSGVRSFFGPRRLALAAEVADEVPASVSSERGPRVGAPEQALAGFLRKHGAAREALAEEGAFWVLNRAAPAKPAASLIAETLPALLRRFPWPKAMRWGGTSAFVWVRPLRRILCLLDGDVVPFGLASGEDDGHGLRSGGETEGHRFLAPGAVRVGGAEDWQRMLAERRVIASAAERKRVIADGVAALATVHGLSVVEDAGLLDEVAGLVEWPVPLLGRIDDAFMDLPPEVMQVSMRVNQRYFALRDADGRPTPWFAFAANVEAPDGGAAIVAGNERVLRARFSDARHFWDLDRKLRLAERVAALDGIVFHADLGTQGERVRRIVRLAKFLAPRVGADVALAGRAALLAKADLTTGMVGEFPELQGVMGGYYALHDGEDARLADAIREHYLPKGPGDAVPREPVGIAVALADKFDQLAGFFAKGHAPTGSGDPFALRRAALGIIRIIRENALRLDLDALLAFATKELGSPSSDIARNVREFVLERLRVLVKSEGGRPDILAASMGARTRTGQSWPADIIRLLKLAGAIAEFLATDDGANLLAAYKRAANILQVLQAKYNHQGMGEPVGPFTTGAERDLNAALHEPFTRGRQALGVEDFQAVMAAVSTLRQPLDCLLDSEQIDTPDRDTMRARRLLLMRVKLLMDEIADLSKIVT